MAYTSTVAWPKRAIVTAGMPYGNKALHFGHVAGVFVPADAFARFMRDRIGKDNVLFVSGTDCFGSPIEEGHRKAVEAGFSGTITDYVIENHNAQKKTLDAYNISLDIYEGSGLGDAAIVHAEMSAAVLKDLHDKGYLQLQSHRQFFDTQLGVFLNGRQVQGFCPVQGCKSEKAYADECDLGHQFAPADLIAPKSVLSDTTPELRPVDNWYFTLPVFRKPLQALHAVWAQDEQIRPVVAKTTGEFLADPLIYIKNELEEQYRKCAGDLPTHEYMPAEKGKQSFSIVFDSIEERDIARDVLTKHHIRFRTGKTLVPLRISGNVSWGVPVPEMDDVSGLTCWCWPESLWAPISFTSTALQQRGEGTEAWRTWWTKKDACVYQFIGQDNLYFYGVAQPALFIALSDEVEDDAWPKEGSIQQTQLVANHHILFGKAKASSSGAVKPPSADELLSYYTVEQLRAHWLALGLDQKSVGFSPKSFDPDEEKRTDSRIADPVLKEGALLTNVFNRLARSCFYEAHKTFDGAMPLGAPSVEVVARAHEVLAIYEQRMQKTALHAVMTLMDDFIRYSNKHWSSGISKAEEAQDIILRRQVLLDSFYLLRVCTLLMHPIAPEGCEKIADYMNVDPEIFFNWDYGFETNDEICPAASVVQGVHMVKELPPRTDFFARHESQFK